MYVQVDMMSTGYHVAIMTYNHHVRTSYHPYLTHNLLACPDKYNNLYGQLDQTAGNALVILYGQQKVMRQWLSLAAKKLALAS